METLWPSLHYPKWRDTYQTLHRWTQIIGKLRMSKSEYANHSWNSVLYVTPVGLTTSPIPDGGRSFSVEFDFSVHQLSFVTSNGQKLALALRSESVASFFERVNRALEYLQIEANFDEHPNELSDSILFSVDEVHATYIPAQVHNFWQTLVRADRLL